MTESLKAAFDDMDISKPAPKTSKLNTPSKPKPTRAGGRLSRGQGGHFEPETETKRTSLDLPTSKHREFKVWTAGHDVDKVDVLRWLVDSFLYSDDLQRSFLDDHNSSNQD